MKSYRINDIFYSLQGEGARAGTANIFLRFSRCNLQCTVASHGFDCDTEFESGKWMAIPEIVSELREKSAECAWVILTGGEPALQLDDELIGALRDAGFSLAIETNGTVQLPKGLDWVTVSPKVPEDELRQLEADEVKYVLSAGMPLPKTVVKARHRLVSPAFDDEQPAEGAVEWCITCVQENPEWRLSVQQHKKWEVR